MLSEPVLFNSIAWGPIAVLLHPELRNIALFPIARLFEPVILQRSALFPKAELFEPTVFQHNALSPMARLLLPVVLQKSALVPIPKLLQQVSDTPPASGVDQQTPVAVDVRTCPNVPVPVAAAVTEPLIVSPTVQVFLESSTTIVLLTLSAIFVFL
jgi:hypothetical protein